MKKLIILLAATVCLSSTQAQTITKIYGKATSGNSTSYYNLETDTIPCPKAVFPNQVQNFNNLSVCYKFEFTNGTSQMPKGDTIIVRLCNKLGYPSDDSLIIILEDTLEAGAKFEYPKGTQCNSNNFRPQMNTFANGGYENMDSIATLELCVRLLYANRYTISQNNRPEKCAKGVFLKVKDPDDAITDYTAMSNVKLYPNPVSSNLTIENLKNIDVEIYNIVGQQIVENKNATGDLSIDMSNLPDGVYFVKLKDGKAVRTEKIKLVK